MTNDRFYTTGGAVQAGGGLYIERPADQELFELCRDRQFVYVLSHRQCGKSSLMNRTTEKLDEEGFKSVRIDLSSIGSENLREVNTENLDRIDSAVEREVSTAVDEWYCSFLYDIESQLNLETDALDWWSSSGVTRTSRLVRFFREIVLKEISEPVVIFIDEIDTVLQFRFRGDFFAAIRYLYQDRAIHHELNRLTFVLIGVATPSELIDDPQRTPFNIGKGIDLSDFTFQEALPLAQGLNLSPHDAQQVLRRVIYWTNGHPFLTQVVCQELVDQSEPNWSTSDVDRVVRRLYFGAEGERNPHLQFIRRFLLERYPENSETLNITSVLSTYKKILRGWPPVADDAQSPVKSHLKLSGVVKREANILHARNRVYRKVFNSIWVKENLPLDNRIERLQRALAVVGLLALVLPTILAFIANSQRILADEQRIIAETNAGIAKENEDRANTEAKKAQSNEDRANAEADKARKSAARAQKNEENARKAADLAQENEKIALEQTKIAETERLRAEDQTLLARQERDRAEAQTNIARQQRARAESSEQTVQEQGRVAEVRALSAESINLLGVEPLRASLLAIQAGGQYIDYSSNFDSVDDTLNLVKSSLYEVVSKSLEANIIADHSEQVSSVTLSPDGETIASASWDGTVRIWDLEGNEISRIGTEKGEIRASSVEFSPDGNFIVSGWEDGDFAVWDLARNTINEYEATKRTIPPSDSTLAPNTVGSMGGVLSLAVSPDAQFVVSGNVEGRVRIWNLEDDTFREMSSDDCPVTSFPNHSCRVNAISISPDGQVIATAHADGTVRKWSFQGEPLGNPLEGHTGQVYAVFVDSSGTVVSGDEGGNIRIWQEDLVQVTWSAHLFAVNSISLISSSGDGLDTVVSGGDDGFIRIWDLSAGSKEIMEIPAHQSNVLDLAFSSDYKKFVSSSRDGTIRLYDYSDVVFRRPVIGKHEQSVNSVVVSPSGQYIASGGRDELVKIWNSNFDQSNSVPVKTFIHDGSVSSLDFDHANMLIAAGSSSSSSVKLWDIQSGNQLPDEGWAEDIVTSIEFSPISERQLLLIGGNSSSYLWNYNYAQDNNAFSAEGGDGGFVWTSTDGQGNEELLSYVPLEHEVSSEYRDAFGRREFFSVPNEIQSVAFSSNAETIISADSNGMVRQWGGIGYIVGEPHRAHSEAISSVAVSPTSQIYATASADWTIRLWQQQYDDPESKKRWSYSIVERTIQFFRFLTDTRILLNPFLQTALEPDSFVSQPVTPPFRGHRGIVWSVSFSPDGQMLASSGHDGTIRLWDLQGNSIGIPLEGHRGPVYSLAFTPDNQFIVSGGADGSVRLWRAGTWQDWMASVCYRLENHLAFREPESYASTFDTDVADIWSAKSACEKHVWQNVTNTN